MSYTQYFDGWRSSSDGCAEIRPYIHIRKPEKLTTPENVAYYDQSAAWAIAELEAIAANLREYRQALAARYGQLETMAYTRLLKLERCPSYRGNIRYIITITRTLSDGSEIEALREVYPGSERHKAKARAADLRKQYPGIPYEQDTEKRSWEK